MGKVTEELQQIAQLRKALMPLVELLKEQTTAEVTLRLEAIEKGLESIAGREVKVKVAAPEIDLSELTTLIKSLDLNMRKAKTPEQPSQYEPHDQAKVTGLQYAGFVRSDGAWYIQRVSKGEQRYSKGSGDYAKAWEKKDKLSYGYIDEG